MKKKRVKYKYGKKIHAIQIYVILKAFIKKKFYEKKMLLEN